MTTINCFTTNDVKPNDAKQHLAELPHAVTLPLSGQYMIEASAGTGKTWTLTGILLRLLIEKGVPCDKIIATTFTRAAAAEMRERIRSRLTTMLRVLRLCTQAMAQMTTEGQIDLSNQQVNAYPLFLDALATLATHSNLTEQVQGDAIHWHLVTWIARQFFEQAESEQPAHKTDLENPSHAATTGTNTQDSTQNSAKNRIEKSTAERVSTVKPIDFRIAILRTSTALNQLDRLFVGTLDSLCQKWLREFSAETGYMPNIEVNTQPESVIRDLVHDQVRAYRAWLASESPELFEAMLENKILPTADDYLPAIQKALTFYTTPIDTLTIQPLNIRAMVQSIENYVNFINDGTNAANIDDFNQYQKQDYRVAQGFNGGLTLHKSFDRYKDLQKVLNEQGLSGLVNLEKPVINWLQSIEDCYKLEKGFKKGFDSQRQQFLANPITQHLLQLALAKKSLDNYISQIHQYFTQYISRYIKTQLPLVLESRHQTTFSLQLARLNQALEGKQGKQLARYIRHQYPVMLVDESQDINTEQAMLLQKVYLTGSNTGFLLLVGDPKQAIYGFRGGDVSNYTAIKSQFPQKPLPLTQNFRSSQALITALNHWFSVPDSAADAALDKDLNNQDSHAQAPYTLGEQIHYRYIQASRADSYLTQADTATSDSASVLLLSVSAKKTVTIENAAEISPASELDYAAAIAGQILALCDPEQGYRYQGMPLQLDHICILADTNRQLDSVEKALQQKAIASKRGGTQSLFSGQMTQDVIALMHAMLYPYDMTWLRRLLMTAFFGLDLQAVNHLFSQHESQLAADNALGQTITPNPNLSHEFTLSAIQTVIAQANKLWLSQGFLSALQWLLNQRFNQAKFANIPLTQVTLADKTTREGITFWQRLAGMSEGERLLVDLRQLMDIISQRTNGLGEHQLLHWLQRLASEQPKEEWSMQQRLASEDGVQLMTIHQSKGLEFAIVFVVGLDKKIRTNKQKYPLYLYSWSTQQPHDPLQHRRLSPLSSNENQDFANEEQQANFEEKLRLAYVAFTRAKDRLYIVTQENHRNERNIPLQHWLEGKDFALPERLHTHIATVDINSLSKYFNPNITYTTLKNTTAANNNIHKDTQPIKEWVDYATWINGITQTQFFGWSNTSFTALARQLNHNKQDVAINAPEYDNLAWDSLALDETASEAGIWLDDDELAARTELPAIVDEGDDLADAQTTNYLANSAQHSPSSLLRFNFEKGTNAGTFLHKILENLPSIDFATSTAEGVNFGLSAETFGFKIQDDELDFYQPAIYDIAGDSYALLLHWTNEAIFDSVQFTTALPEDRQIPTGEDSHFKQFLTGLPASWQSVIDRAIDNYQISPQYRSHPKMLENPQNSVQSESISLDYVALVAWLYQVVQTPLLASNIPLNELSPKQKIHELSFNMSLRRDFSIAMLNELFAIEGVQMTLYTQKQISHYWRYLRGEIDLVYQHAGKFFVVDYKSNYLGNGFEHYHQTALEQAMDAHGYWLQAGIYQVALHRYLQLRLPNYDINTHLGGVEYVFLRGMHPEKPDYGRLLWQPSPTFILALDMLLGRAE